MGTVLVAVTVVGGIRYFGVQGTERSFARYYQAAENSYTHLRGSTKDIDPNLTLALSLYENEDFKAAAPLFSKYISDAPNDFGAVYLAGIAFLETQQFDKAIDAFKRTRVNSQEYYENATWYLALSYIQGDQTNKAKNILRELIASTGHSKTDAARKLLLEIS